MNYAAKLDPAPEGGFVVTFRDIPEAITQGETEQEALDMAHDALLCAMDFYFEDRRAVPPPSAPKRGERLVSLPASVSAKVMVLNQVVASNLSNAELARRMGSRPQEVQRIMNLEHATKIDTLDAVLHALGKRLEFIVC